MCDVPTTTIIIIIKIVNDTVLKDPSALTYLVSIFTISGRCEEVLHRIEQCVIPGFIRGVNEPCALWEFTQHSFLLMFRDNLLCPIFKGPIYFPETS